jgi:dTDP-4-dehydrorhamnose 3,5-epimerase
MIIKETKIQGCYIVECNRHYDKRGFFQEIYSDNHYEQLTSHWKQANWSYSAKGTLRGIHQAPFNKLVTCVKGSILDVVVDMRPDSPTFKKHELFSINDTCPQQIFIPSNCGHGFIAFVDSTVMYLQDDTYKPGQEKSWKWNKCGIKWPHLPSNLIISDKDQNAPIFIS